ncbi:hypothetical protein JXB28_05640 [Candidatus Woesearchaeota archaeon]|nr:hypothetical protein [Candidatus Woesearchaeota archaeon]
MDKLIPVAIVLIAIVFAGFLLVSANVEKNTPKEAEPDAVDAPRECSGTCGYDSPCKGACGGGCGVSSCGCGR